MCYDVARQIFKISTYIVVFVFVLGLAIISKGSLLLATSKLRPHPKLSDHDLACSDYKEWYNESVSRNVTNPILESGYANFTYCVALPRQYNISNVHTLTCLLPANISGNVSRYNTNLPDFYLADECVVMRIYWAWSILLMICSPYVFVFCRNIWIIIFRSKKSPDWKVLGCVLFIETLHCVGLCFLMFLVLPSLDNVIQGLMIMLGVALLPSSLKIFIRPKEDNILNIILDVLAFASQVSVLIVWPIVTAVNDEDETVLSRYPWAIPFSLVLVSVRWWENYLDRVIRLGRIRKPLLHLAGKVRRSRTKIQLVASVWKIGVSIAMMMICVGLQIDQMAHGPGLFTTTTDKYMAVFNVDLK